jgi:hypothetical protein
MKMPGVLNLTTPTHLLEKLGHECRALTERPNDSYAAINALRDAYHLHEWIWHAHLEREPALQTAIMSRSGKKCRVWREWVDEQFPDFEIIRELCNGSKHFKRKGNVEAANQAGWDSPLFAFDVGILGYDVEGFFVQLDAGRIVSVMHLVEEARDFWAALFQRFPCLA